MKKVGLGILITSIMSLLVFVIVSWNLANDFEKGCEDWLNKIPTAKTLDEIDTCLDTAISYLEENNMVLKPRLDLIPPSEDFVQSWSKQIINAHKDLLTVKNKLEEFPSLDVKEEQQNYLHRLEFTLFPFDQKNASVPHRISWYPHNENMWTWIIVNVGMLLIGLMVTFPDMCELGPWAP